MTDIEIARNTKLDNIVDVAKKVDVGEEDLELYGKYKAKFSSELYGKVKDRKDGKLILVTAISPTPLGEGKTTMSIAIADGLRKINKKSILALRDPYTKLDLQLNHLQHEYFHLDNNLNQPES